MNDLSEMCLLATIALTEKCANRHTTVQKLLEKEYRKEIQDGYD